MTSILDGKKILTVDDEPDVLRILEDEILEACPNCKIDKATSYREAMDMMVMWTYDLVVLDIIGVRGFDLLRLAVSRNFPVVILTAHALSPEALKQSFDSKARAYLPKEKLGEIVPFLEDVLSCDYLLAWKRVFEKLEGFLDTRFGADWREKTGLHWENW